MPTDGSVGRSHLHRSPEVEPSRSESSPPSGNAANAGVGNPPRTQEGGSDGRRDHSCPRQPAKSAQRATGIGMAPTGAWLCTDCGARNVDHGHIRLNSCNVCKAKRARIPPGVEITPGGTEGAPSSGVIEHGSVRLRSNSVAPGVPSKFRQPSPRSIRPANSAGVRILSKPRMSKKRRGKPSPRPSTPPRRGTGPRPSPTHPPDGGVGWRGGLAAAALLEFLRPYSSNDSSSWQGASIDQIHARFANHAASDVTALVLKLCEEGDLYNTIDDDHFAVIH